MSNKNLHKAKEAKNDEFYTQLYDIENEILRYVTPGNNPFEGKTVLCPCDDPLESNFTRFFAINFSRLGLKKFISTGYKKDGKGKKYVLEGDTDGNGVIDIDDIVAEDLEGDGDFRSDEVTRLRDEADIICTNPPFSMFREFIKWINPAEKKFIIMGNQAVSICKEIFPLLKSNKIWLGISIPTAFNTPSGSLVKLGSMVRWFTNIQHGKRKQLLKLLTEQECLLMGITYDHYVNYDAIDIPSVSIIPDHYPGNMGVPATFLDYYNPDQFELIGIGGGESGKAIGIGANLTSSDFIKLKAMTKSHLGPTDLVYIDSNNNLVQPFRRIIIRKKTNS